jgi:DNA polymerase (family X)
MGKREEKEMKSKFKSVDVLPLINYLSNYLKLNTKRYEVVGSYRRKKEEIGDLEFLVIGLTTKEILNWLKKSKTLEVKSILWLGDKKMAVMVNYGKIQNLQLEFYITEKRYWHAAILTRTGSGMFNIVMRGKAKKQGFKLNEYGLFNLSGQQVNYKKTEKGIMEKLGMDWHKPEERNM